MAGYSNMRSIRGNRYAREDRVRQMERGARRQVYDGQQGLLRKKKEVTKQMNEKVERTIFDLLKQTCPKETEAIRKELEIKIYKRFPSPLSRLFKAVDFIQNEKLVDTSSWTGTIQDLKKLISRSTDPNQFYVARGY